MLKGAVKLKIDSNKKAVISGVLLGTCVFCAYALFTCLLYYLLGGENFVYKGETRDVVNGISFNVVQIMAVVISAVIPILLIRYKKIYYYELSVFIGIALYALYFIAYFVCLSSMPIEMALRFPMNSFDAIIFGIFNFPFGAIIGIIINVGVNFLRNRK